MAPRRHFTASAPTFPAKVQRNGRALGLAEQRGERESGTDRGGEGAAEEHDWSTSSRGGVSERMGCSDE